ncbi:MAG: Tim44 domain-containing protein [Alphaproteobacteria bacterium]|nr:Tim44 domain-containing protein [Alphaproteobacteria bacterium]NCQ88447.1 Tim44 domain-containing protein [Alphaproteobacteria bacterium]NCT05990.1 Tim44 domain-containing protein [Alphaproteobacteria bacterium]
MSVDILLFALIAAGLIFWLRSILGTHDEDAGSKKTSIFTEEEKERLEKVMQSHELKEASVVPLGNSVQSFFNLPRYATIENKTTENRLEDLIKKDKKLDLGHFVEGAKFAFPMIVEAFSEGDKETLEDLLAPSVYKSFEHAIDEREKTGETVQTDIHAVRKVDITEVTTKENIIYLAVRFTADETCVIRDKEGKIISGDPDKVTEMRDVWVFGREMNSDDPAWRVYETREGGEEEGQSPMPDAT